MRGGNNIDERYSIGDTVRLMIQYCCMNIIMGRWTQPITDLRKDFVEYLDSFVKRKKLKVIDEKT